MTASVGPVSGTAVYIGPSAALGAGLPSSPDSFIRIHEISNLGNIAQQFAEIAVESIDTGDTYQIKGQRSFPNLTIVMNRSDADTGQLALKAASAAARGTLYFFKILEKSSDTDRRTAASLHFAPCRLPSPSVRPATSGRRQSNSNHRRVTWTLLRSQLRLKKALSWK